MMKSAVHLTVKLKGGSVERHEHADFEVTDKALVVHMGNDVAGLAVKRTYPMANVLDYTTTGESDAEQPPAEDRFGAEDHAFEDQGCDECATCSGRREDHEPKGGA